MATMLGSLLVSLGLNSAAFERGTERAGKKVNALGDQAEKVGFKVGTMAKTLAAGGAALAGSALVQQLGAVIEKGLDYARTMDRMATLTGSTTEEFQKAAYAAKSVGIETDKLGDIYKDVNDKVGDFLSTGGGELKDFFENIAPKVGVTADQFRNLSGPQALQLYVSSLEKANLTQSQMTFYMEAIANDATLLLPLLKNNGEGFRLMGEEARKAGIILTQDQISKAGETAKRIEALKNALSVRVSAIVIENADAIGTMAESLAKMLNAMLALIRIGSQFANSPAGKLLGQINQGASYLNPIGAIIGGLEQVGQRMSPSQRTTGGAAPVRATPSQPNWQGTTTAPMLGRGGSSVYRGPVANFAGGGIMPTASGTFAGMQPGQGPSLYDRIWEQTDRLAAVQGVLVDETKEAAKSVEIANVQIARSFLESSQDSIYAIERLSNAVQGGGFLNILSAVVGLGLQLGSIGAFGKSVSARINAPAVPGFASGTRFAPGGLAVVGERGPELMNVPRGSQIVPNHKLAGLGGMQLQVVPSPYFDVRVQENIGQAAPVIAAAGGQAAQRNMAWRQTRRVG